MPIRHEGDARVEIHDWDSWIEKELREARDRGEFDNLPGAGKPLNHTSTDINKDWHLAFSRLKNAGVLPAWMELDRDCYRGRAELDAFLARSAVYLQEQLELLAAASGDPVEPRDDSGQPTRTSFLSRMMRWLAVPTDEDAERAARTSLTREGIRQMRGAIKGQYLERAQALDKTIVEFNHSLSREMSHLERMRMTPERARRRFDAGCPEIP